MAQEPERPAVDEILHEAADGIDGHTADVGDPGDLQQRRRLADIGVEPAP